MSEPVSNMSRLKHVRELQAMVADPSGCGTLSLLLRILFSPDIIPNGIALAERIVRLVLEWPESSEEAKDAEKDDQRGAVFYAAAGEKIGSYFLETTLECAPLPFMQQLVAGAILTSAEEYASDAVANFVIQAVLRRLTAELDRKAKFISVTLGEGGSMKSLKKSERSVLKTLCFQSKTLLLELVADGVFAKLVSQRGGVILWMIQCGSRLDEMIDALGEETSDEYELKSDESYAAKICGMLYNIWTSQESGEMKPLGRVLAAKIMPVDKSTTNADSLVSAQLLTCKLLEVRS
jgi:hypothetical protein